MKVKIFNDYLEEKSPRIFYLDNDKRFQYDTREIIKIYKHRQIPIF